MTEWESKYHALCMGIKDKSLIDAGERIFKIAFDMSISSGKTLSECTWAIINSINSQRQTKNVSNDRSNNGI